MQPLIATAFCALLATAPFPIFDNIDVVSRMKAALEKRAKAA